MITEILIRCLVKNPEKPEDPKVRLSYGMLCGYTGIAVNFFLFCVKLAIGLVSGSIAIAADAVNNLSDAGSSVITVFGFKMSTKPADNEHPFGHGRLEYVAGLIVAVIILAVGANFFKESFMKLFSDSPVRMSWIMIAFFTATLLFKLWLFFFYSRVAGRIQSQILKAAAFDSLSDMLGTSVVIGAVIAGNFTKFPVDACAGMLVAGLVVYGGIGILRDTINPLLGQCADHNMVEELRGRLLKCPGIRGVHDIIIHNYGPNQYFATAHAEVSHDGDLLQVHDTLEAAEVEIAKHMPIRLVLHCDPYDVEDPEVKIWRVRTEDSVMSIDIKFKVYDFRVTGDETSGRKIHFHLLIPRNYALSCDEITREIQKRMENFDPKLTLHIDFKNSFV